MDNIEEYLTLDEVSNILKVHKNTLRNWDNDGTLKAVRVGAKKIRRYRYSDVKRFMKQAEKCSERRKNNHEI